MNTNEKLYIAFLVDIFDYTGGKCVYCHRKRK